jgi:hypothetical protein
MRPGKLAAAACCLALAGCGGSPDSGAQRLTASEQAHLLASVRDARAAAGAGDRSRAIKALGAFRSEIARLAREGAIDPARLRVMRRLAIQATRRAEAEIPAPAPAPTPPSTPPPATTTTQAPTQPTPAKQHPKKEKKAHGNGAGKGGGKANGKAK